MVDEAYLDICRDVLANGIRTKTRTGTDSLSIPGTLFQYDMSSGKFPLLTTKEVSFKPVRTELEFLIGGNTDKGWLQKRGNHIWDPWANPEKAPYGHDKVSKNRMLEERDMGAVYGFLWRHWGAKYIGHTGKVDYSGQGIDQLAGLVDSIKNEPDRRMMVNSWNPSYEHQQALPACHYNFQVLVSGDDRLHLLWNQRSVDVPLGLPFNIASYALMQTLLANEGGFGLGKLTGFLADTHIYVNQIDGIEEQISRAPMELCTIETDENVTSLLDWKHDKTKSVGYKGNHHPKIEFPIAV